MITTLVGYQPVQDFAKRYMMHIKSTNTSRQSSRSTLYKLIAKERANPNSTDIDLFVICGKVFVKYRVEPSHEDRQPQRKPQYGK